MGGGPEGDRTHLMVQLLVVIVSQEHKYNAAVAALLQ
jgi:hypothetical protein